MRLKILYLFMLGILLINISSAEIFFENDFEEVYNLGERINVGFYIKTNFSTSDYLEAYLICNRNQELIFKGMKDIEKEKKNNFSISFFSAEEGNCEINVRFNNLEADSEEFEISDDISIDLDINNNNFLPSEKLILNGTAKKENKEDAEGLAEVYIKDILNKSFSVSEGKFYSEIDIPENAKPGNHTLRFIVSDGKNQGTVEKEISISSSPSYINITSEESFKPRGNLSIKLELLDQTKNFLEDKKILLKVFNPLNELALEKTLDSGENISIYFESDSISGRWKINAYHGYVSSSKPLYILENPLLETEVITNEALLRVRNIGNADYEGIIEVEVQGEDKNKTIPFNINLSKAETRDYDLNITGRYNLSVGDQDFRNIELTKDRITGAAVSLDFETLNKNSYFYLLALIVLAGIIYLAIKKDFFIKSRNYLNSKLFKKNKPVVEKNKHPITKNNQGAEKNFDKQDDKRRVYVCFIKTDNFNKLEQITQKYNYSLQKVSDKLSFILFYSSDTESKKDILSFVKELKHNFKPLSVVIHSEEFNGKMSSLNSAFLTKEIAKRVEGIFVTSDFYKLFTRLRVKNSREFSLKEKLIKIYELII